ncbi:MAG: KdsC family phosphatase [Candidatus Zixiibacteriota bacterium]
MTNSEGQNDVRFGLSCDAGCELPDIEELALLVYDFDGVMTDNKVMIDEDGRESVVVNRSDGLAVAEFKKLGVRQFILSTEVNAVVLRRADKLGIPCLNNCADKRAALQAYLQKNQVNANKVVYCGNDINDLAVMQIVGLPVAPADANWRIREIAKYVTRARGGEGVIRELYDVLVRPMDELPENLVAA